MVSHVKTVQSPESSNVRPVVLIDKPDWTGPGKPDKPDPKRTRNRTKPDPRQKEISEYLAAMDQWKDG